MQTPLMPPLLSIVVPTRDRPALLTETLRALVPAGADADWTQLLLCDDGREAPVALDAVAAAVAPLPLPALLPPDGQTGQAAAVNRGLAAARGRYVLVLHDDDVLQPGALAALRPWLEQGRAAALVLPMQVWRGGPPPAPATARDPVAMAPGPLAAGMLDVRTFIPSQFIAAADLALRYDPAFEYLCDWSFCARVLLAGHAAGRPVLRIEGPGVLYRQHEGALSSGLAGAAGFAAEHVVLMRALLAEEDLAARLGLTAGRLSRFLQRAARWRRQRVMDWGVPASGQDWDAALAPHLERLQHRKPALVPDIDRLRRALQRLTLDRPPGRIRTSLRRTAAALGLRGAGPEAWFSRTLEG